MPSLCSKEAVPWCRSAVSRTVAVPSPVPPCLVETRSPSICSMLVSLRRRVVHRDEPGPPEGRNDTGCAL